MPTTLYISYDGMTDPLGQSQVIPYLKGLSKRGFNILLISFEKKFRNNEIELIKRELATAGILWKPLRYHKSPSLPATILDLLTGTLFAIYYCKKYSIKLIHCRGHYLTSLIAFVISPLHKFKYIFDMRGFWADERIEGGIWNTNRILHKYQYLFFKKMERKFIKMADQVITLTVAAKEIVESRFEVRNEVVVIPCCTDLEMFGSQVIYTNKLLKQAKNEGRMVLVYLGSLGTWYILDKMLVFFKILKEEKNSVFLFITTEPSEIIQKEANKIGLSEKDLIIIKASRHEIPSLLSSADAGIFFIKPVFSKSGSSPVKHGEMMVSSLPVVTNWGIGDTEKIIRESKTGVVLQNWEPDSMRIAAKGLLKLVEEKDPSRYYEAAKRYYSLNLAINKYIEIYSRLSNE